MAHAGIKITNGTFHTFYFVNATAGEAFRMPAGGSPSRIVSPEGGMAVAVGDP
jgi:hypothetical protein